ncbi:hypothetical protein HJFPF1_13052 [Paramyrothecium foliicola]|nr:hypothetical protein HJFPF1_13052 [Paramyrothecium foliicola]
MQLTSAFALFAFAGFSSAECYGSGADWYDRDNAALAANAACGQQLGGTYGPESTFNGQKAACVNTVNGKIDFIITHISEGEMLLPQDECYDGLQKEIYGCGKGGETSYTNWRYKYVLRHPRSYLITPSFRCQFMLTSFVFRADPNEGSC